MTDDNQHFTMAFEDVHRLVSTIRMAEVILNEIVQNSRRTKTDRIKVQLDAEHCPNMSALLAELQNAKQCLTQKHSFRSIGAFDVQAYDLEGDVLFETMMIARAVNWLARLSTDPNTETRRGTLSVFSELQAAYSSHRALHELYFHHHEEKQLLEKRIRGAMRDLGEQISKAAVAPLGSAFAKRQKVAVELKGISDLMEEMLSVTQKSYGASLVASQMGHLAFEHNVTVCELRSRIAELQTEIRCWVQRSSHSRRNSCHDSR
jgi:hypothetical protein